MASVVISVLSISLLKEYKFSQLGMGWDKLAGTGVATAQKFDRAYRVLKNEKNDEGR